MLTCLANTNTARLKPRVECIYLMKIDMQNLVAKVREVVLKEKGGLSRGNMLKAGYEYFESVTGKNPTKEEKDTIRGVIQENLNTLGFRQDYEVVVSDKSYTRLTTGGEIIHGRTTKFVDTRQMGIQRQTQELWTMLGAHMEYRAKHPLYEGTEAEETKTMRLRRNLNDRLYQLDSGNEVKQRCEKQLVKWFPPSQPVQEQVNADFTSTVKSEVEKVAA